MRAWMACGLAALIATLPPLAAAETVGDLLVTTNYVWRGISLSRDRPSVIGGVSWSSGEAWHAMAQAAGVVVRDDRGESAEQQIIVRAGRRFGHGAVRFDLGAVAYEYPRGDRFDPATGRLVPNSGNNGDFPELYLGAAYGNGEFRYSRSEDYLGSGELSHYYELNFAVPLAAGSQILLHYGYSDTRAIIDHAYRLSDTAFGIVKEPFSLLLSSLDDHEDGLQSENLRFVVSWHNRVEILP